MSTKSGCTAVRVQSQRLQIRCQWFSFCLRLIRQLRVVVFSRPLRYSPVEVPLPDGTKRTILRPREKGIDVRIALDVVRAARENRGNVFLIFSQDQDLTEAIDEVKIISRTNKSNIRVASAYPSSPSAKNDRGIDKTDWIRIDKATYDACVDPTNYRIPGVLPPPASR